MTEVESEPLPAFLFRHRVRPALCRRFRRRSGSMAIWNDRAARHDPVDAYPGHTRLMPRITPAGDVPV